MIEITVKIIPNGNKKQSRTIGIMHITNDGTGTILNGNYNYDIHNKECFFSEDNAMIEYDKEVYKGEIKDFPRELKFWSLLQRIFNNIPEIHLSRK